MLASANLTNWSLYPTGIVNQRQWGTANLTNWSLFSTSVVQDTVNQSSNALQALKVNVNNGVFTNLTGSRLTVSSNLTYTEGFWQDVLCPLIAGGVPAVNAADLELLVGGIEAYRFDSGQSNCVFVTVQLPHGIKRVTNNVHPHMHWTCATPTTNIIWGLQYVQANISGILTNSAGTVFFTNTCDTAFKHCVQSWPYIDIVGSTNSDSQIMHCKIFRPNDGVAQDVFGLSFDPHCLIESPGSIPEIPTP